MAKAEKKKNKVSLSERFMCSSFVRLLFRFSRFLDQRSFTGAVREAGMVLIIPVLCACGGLIIAVAGSELFGFFTADSVAGAYFTRLSDFVFNYITLWSVPVIAVVYSARRKRKQPWLNGLLSLMVFACLCFSIKGRVNRPVLPDAAAMPLGYLCVFLTCLIEEQFERIIPHSEEKNLPEPLRDVIRLLPAFAVSLLIFSLTDLFTVIISESGGLLDLSKGLMYSLMPQLNTFIGPVLLVFLMETLRFLGIDPLFLVWGYYSEALKTAINAKGLLLNVAGTLTYRSAFDPSMMVYAGILAAAASSFTAFSILNMADRDPVSQRKGMIAVLPSFFGIQAAAQYSFPFAFDPLLCLGSFTVTSVNGFLMWLAWRFEFAAFPYKFTTLFLPLGFQGYMSTLNFRGLLPAYILLAADLVLWLPFLWLKRKRGEAAGQ